MLGENNAPPPPVPRGLKADGIWADAENEIRMQQSGSIYALI